MAKVIHTIPDEDKVCMSDSATGEKCMAEKVVDVTEDCPRANEERPAILFFTKAQGERIVQIRRPSKGEYGGPRIHFSVDELDETCNNTIGAVATLLGLTKQELRALIEEHAPAA